MFSCFKTKSEKKITTRGLFIGAMSLVKLITEIRVYICHKNMKSMGFFYGFAKVLAENFYKKYSTGNEEITESETATITNDYLLYTY